MVGVMVLVGQKIQQKRKKHEKILNTRTLKFY
jgi:hypothetical protein